MRVLLTNHAMTELGGTQTWVKTVASELIRRGIDVDVFTLLKGDFAKSMPCDVFTEIPDVAYDVAFVNHNTCLGMLASKVPDYPVVFTSHGPAHMLERPAGGATHYVAVSEEVRAMQVSLGFYNSTVIRNPIDFNEFYPREVENIGDVLVMCKNIKASKVAELACCRAGFSYTIAHYQANPIPYEKIPEYIAQHKIVITSGRGVYETLACGRKPFLFDVRSGKMGGDGWVTSDNIAELAQYNCSGRGSNNHWTELGLMSSLQSPINDAPPVEWVAENHNVETVVDKYLAVVGSQERVTA